MAPPPITATQPKALKVVPLPDKKISAPSEANLSREVSSSKGSNTEEVTTIFRGLSVDQKDTAAVEESSSKIDVAKKAKALKKKLREIEELEKRPSSELSEEQRHKVEKKSTIEAELISIEAAMRDK